MSERKILPGRLEEVLDLCLLERNNPAVLLIDMQEGYAQDVFWDQCFFDEIVERQAELLCYAKEKAVPIFIAEFLRRKFGITIPRLMKNLIGYKKKKIFVKPNEDAFKDTQLEKDLCKAEIDTILVMGLYTNDCVLRTARRARELEFQVITAPTVIYGHCPTLAPFYFEECKVYDDRKVGAK